MKIHCEYSKPRLLATLLTAGALLAGCSSNDNDDPIVNAGLEGAPFLAFTSVRDTNYSVSKLERLSVSPETTATISYISTKSDYTVATDGEAVYHLGQFQIDSVTKYDAQDPSNLIYQRSVAGDDVSANPYDIVFVNDTKAYIVRYGSDKIWIVDPSATTDETFKTGELDLSAYADGDGLPEASGAVVVGNKLFVLMERLESFSPTQPGYLAVFNTTMMRKLIPEQVWLMV